MLEKANLIELQNKIKEIRCAERHNDIVDLKCAVKKLIEKRDFLIAEEALSLHSQSLFNHAIDFIQSDNFEQMSRFLIRAKTQKIHKDFINEDFDVINDTLKLVNKILNSIEHDKKMTEKPVEKLECLINFLDETVNIYERVYLHEMALYNQGIL